MIAAIRHGAPEDAAALADLINLAYEAERFFVLGDRTNEDDVRREMTRGTFLVATDSGGRLVGCVIVEATGTVGQFGMLAVDPALQGRGIGRQLIAAAETEVRQAGAASMEILVVNLRDDLLALYGRLGYTASGTRPYVHRPTIRSCHFIVMRKELT